MTPWTEKSRIVITCAKGVTPFLKKEIEGSGLPILSEDAADIETEGRMLDAMRLNLFLRTGQRVLFLIERFDAERPDELYRELSKVPWEDLIPADGYFSVTSSVDTPSITDSRFANLKCKDAIADRIQEKCGRRPDSGPQRDRAVVHLYWKGKRCRVYIDTSGEPLYRRGYRKISLKAPMQETLAAAVVIATAWSDDGNFVNPMCGSGTLAVEAALIGLNRAPGLLRNNFGFMHLKEFDERSWKELRASARREGKKGLKEKIIATDIDKKAIEAAKKNAETAGVAHHIEFGVCDYSETPIPKGSGVVVLNPEYGERMGALEELKKTYEGIGDFFKKRCQGYRGYVFTGNFGLAKKVGLRTKRRLPFFNGNIECRLLEYDLYEGSRKKPAPQN
jgi:putative N6-adenine-specific DNA methylase